MARTLLLAGQNVPEQLVELIATTTPVDVKPLLRSRLTQLAQTRSELTKEVGRLLAAVEGGDQADG